MFSKTKSRNSSGRKVILVIISLVIGTTTLCGFAVDFTRSLTHEYLDAIRNDFSVYSSVERYYWLKFTSAYAKEDSLYYPDDRYEMDYFNSEDPAKSALWGAVGLDMPVTDPPTTDSMKLDLARDYLLDPNDPD